MKRNFAYFLMCLLAAMPAVAQSTCETRVDSHPQATTKQRVAYCLTPEKEPPAPAGPQLVYYGVSSNEPEPEPQEQSTDREPVYFDKDGVEVNQQFMDTKSFPSFENDTLSTQERAALERLAREDAAQAVAVRRASVKTPAQEAALAATPKLEAPSVLSEETQIGLLARHKKPKRFMKKAAPTSVQTQTQEVAQPVAAANQPLVPTGTPSGEIQQAYALENNPVSPQPAANNGTAVPNGFLDDDLMVGEQNFGYNATDPAMQP